jgi:photosystem II stability/assembly factor-like uncharacterized protein
VCDDQEECVLIAVTEDDITNSYMAVNTQGGKEAGWGAPITLTALGANDANQVACAGGLVVIVSTANASVLVSPDLGTTQIDIATTDMGSHAPASVDMMDQSFIVVGAADGYIYGSYDGGQDQNTWETLSDGGATALAITRIMIARDNPQVIYGVSNAGDVIIKSENGGRTWFAQQPTGGGNNITALCVVNQNHVLVGTDAGEVYESVDGGDAWTEQTTLGVLTAATKANTTIKDIVDNGCGELGLVTENTSDDEGWFLRNVDNGASGKWFHPDECEDPASGKDYNGLACCGNNHFVGAGGEAATDDFVALIA